MKFLTTLALATAASASALQHRQDSTQVLIDQFNAVCVPLTGHCFYVFAIESEPTHAVGSCSVEVPPSDANGSNLLPDITSFKCDRGTDQWQYSFSRNEDGSLWFQVAWPLSEYIKDQYCYTIPKDQLVIADDGAGSHDERYVGPTSFYAQANQCGVQ